MRHSLRVILVYNSILLFPFTAFSASSLLQKCAPQEIMAVLGIGQSSFQQVQRLSTILHARFENGLALVTPLSGSFEPGPFKVENGIADADPVRLEELEETANLIFILVAQFTADDAR